MFSYLLLLLLPLLASAKETICLNMIVKDERDVIERCLSSVKDVIDYWVIVDTGSTDGTQKIIRKYLKETPGELHQSSWTNFAVNRNEALGLAKEKGDYILFMDADDVLEFEGDPGFSELTVDQYTMWRGSEDFKFLKPQLVRAELPWSWVGLTHEYLGCDGPYSSETLPYVKYVTMGGGASAKNPKKKFLTNVKLLRQGLKEEPDNVRYAFYLAESYRDAGEPGKALEWFQKRIEMGGWDEETFWSKLQSAILLQKMGLPPSVVIEAFLHAHRYRPHRLEPLYYAAAALNHEGDYSKAYEYLKSASFILQPKERDCLFNMEWINKYGILFQLSIASYYLGHYEESIELCDQLLRLENLPESWREQVVANREFPVAKLKEKEESTRETPRYTQDDSKVGR